MAMLVVVSYDVSTEKAEGRRRLRKVAKECLNFGQRVQNSVFECVLDPDLQTQKFSFCPLPGELEAAWTIGENQLLERLAGDLEESKVPVYYGRP